MDKPGQILTGVQAVLSRIQTRSWPVLVVSGVSVRLWEGASKWDGQLSDGK